MVSLRAPRELERYVFSPGGRSDSLVQAGGEEGLPEGPEEGAPWGEDADVAKAIINDSGIKNYEQKIEQALKFAHFVLNAWKRRQGEVFN